MVCINLNTHLNGLILNPEKRIWQHLHGGKKPYLHKHARKSQRRRCRALCYGRDAEMLRPIFERSESGPGFSQALTKSPRQSRPGAWGQNGKTHRRREQSERPRRRAMVGAIMGAKRPPRIPSAVGRKNNRDKVAREPSNRQPPKLRSTNVRQIQGGADAACSCTREEANAEDVVQLCFSERVAALAGLEPATYSLGKNCSSN